MKTRLKVLLDNKIISSDIYDFSLMSYETLLGESLKQSSLEVLITHLAMASERIRNGNPVDFMGDDILTAIKDDSDFNDAVRLTELILSNSDIEFPPSETQFMWLHMVNSLKGDGGENND